MNCISEILYRLRETRNLNEMAVEWKDIKSDLVTKETYQVLTHLVKLYYWGTSKERIDYWKKDIYSLCPTISLMRRAKGKPTFPKKDKIFGTIWDKWGDRFKSIERQLNADPDYSEEEYPRINIDSGAIEFCKRYIEWYAERLSIEGAVTIEEVSKAIDKLIGEIPKNK